MHGRPARLHQHFITMAGKKREREGEEAAPAGGGERKQRGYSRLDAETMSYYEEIGGRFAELDDDEERTLLADNALGECVERGAADVGTDAACSRVLEKLLPHAGTEALCAFTQACVEGDNLGTMCTSGPFGSHVLEKCTVELGKRAAAAGDDNFARIEEALTAVAEACAASLYEMATSKYGSFVARRLLCVLAGRDVAPPPGKKPAAQPEPAAGSGEAGQAAAPAGPRGGGALAAKLGSSGGQGGDGSSGASQGADYPALLEKLATTVLGDDWSGEEMQRLSTDSFAGPFLQALLRACTHNQKLQQRLLLQVLGGASSKGIESVSMERCHALLQDRNGSHLMEVVFSTAPDDYFAKLTTLCFKGHLLQLAQHPAANFGVQAALAALRKPQQLKRMFEDLKPAFPQLLRSRRSGVIAALLAAAGRLGAQEAEAAAALWSAAGSGGAAASPLEALLTLDTTTQLGQGNGRLSTLGCAMAGTLLRLPAAACKQWADAVAALPPGQLQHVAKDPGGCRVLEAYLEGPGSAAKKRRALLRGLAGAWGDIALGGSGSHFVEKAYALAEVAEKEAIAGELAAAEPRLLQTHRGPLLLRRCHVDAFKKGSDGWQKRVAAADAARREFEDLFGDGGPGEEEGEEQAAGDAAAGAAAGEDEPAEQQQQPKKKKKKGKTAAAAAAAEADEEQQAPQEDAAEQAASGKKKKKRSKAEQAEAAAAADDEQQPAIKKKKKGKGAAVAQEQEQGEQQAAATKPKKKKSKGSAV